MLQRTPTTTETERIRIRMKQLEINKTEEQAQERLREIEQENTRLRAVFPKILEAIGSGACSNDSSVEFLERIPDDVALVMRRLTRERNESRWIAELYRQVMDKLSDLLDETPNLDPLPFIKKGRRQERRVFDDRQHQPRTCPDGGPLKET